LFALREGEDREVEEGKGEGDFILYREILGEKADDLSPRLSEG